MRKFGELLNTSSESIEAQDYIIRMIAKRGRVVSKKRELYCEIVDLCYDENEITRIFRMNLVDSSILDIQSPEFTSPKNAEGLIGSWKLQANGLLKFLEPYDGPCSTESICDYLLNEASHPIVRSRYERMFGKSSVSNN